MGKFVRWDRGGGRGSGGDPRLRFSGPLRACGETEQDSSGGATTGYRMDPLRGTGRDGGRRGEGFVGRAGGPGSQELGVVVESVEAGVPLAAFLFGHASLIAFLTLETVFEVDGAAFLGSGENVFGGVVEVSFAGEGGGDAFVEEGGDLDVALIDAVGGGDFQMVADLDGCGGFEGGGAPLNVAGGAFLCGKATGFQKPGGPEPFVDTNGFWHG